MRSDIHMDGLSVLFRVISHSVLFGLPHRSLFIHRNGEDEKGMKFEWMTVKGGDLYIGG